MIKVFAVVAAVISSIIAITIYSVTLPNVQKQVEDNSAAITSNETYIKTVNDDLENLQDAFDDIDTRVETLENKKLYLHSIYFKYNETVVRVNYYSSKSAFSSFSDFFSELTVDSYILCESLLWHAFKRQSNGKITYLYVNQGVYVEDSSNAISNITDFSDSTTRVF